VVKGLRENYELYKSIHSSSPFLGGVNFVERLEPGNYVEAPFGD
jgi:hypothetical protein